MFFAIIMKHVFTFIYYYVVNAFIFDEELYYCRQQPPGLSPCAPPRVLFAGVRRPHRTAVGGCQPAGADRAAGQGPMLERPPKGRHSVRLSNEKPCRQPYPEGNLQPYPEGNLQPQL